MKEPMVGVKSIAKEFSSFIDWLSHERPAAIAQVAQLANGFEGWIKIEFFLWLTTVRRPSLGTSDVGVEYKFSLDTRDAPKQCDIWVRDGRRDLYHYVEIKVPFANTNRGKILDSAAADFILLTQMRTIYEQAASANVIVVGVRFDDVSWDRALNRVRRTAGIITSTCSEFGGPIGATGLFRWHAFTKSLDG